VLMRLRQKKIARAGGLCKAVFEIAGGRGRVPRGTHGPNACTSKGQAAKLLETAHVLPRTI